ncbi:hypothetical protein J6590_102943, partial [Homalodisca vitripennis]
QFACKKHYHRMLFERNNAIETHFQRGVQQRKPMFPMGQCSVTESSNVERGCCLDGYISAELSFKFPDLNNAYLSAIGKDDLLMDVIFLLNECDNGVKSHCDDGYFQVT